MSDDMHREAFEREWVRSGGRSEQLQRGGPHRSYYKDDLAQTGWLCWCLAIRHLTDQNEQNEQRDSHE